MMPLIRPSVTSRWSGPRSAVDQRDPDAGTDLAPGASAPRGLRGLWEQAEVPGPVLRRGTRLLSARRGRRRPPRRARRPLSGRPRAGLAGTIPSCAAERSTGLSSSGSPTSRRWRTPYCGGLGDRDRQRELRGEPGEEAGLGEQARSDLLAAWLAVQPVAVQPGAAVPAVVGDRHTKLRTSGPSSAAVSGTNGHSGSSSRATSSAGDIQAPQSTSSG